MTQVRFAQMLDGYRVALEELQACKDSSARTGLLIQMLMIRDLLEGVRSDSEMRMTVEQVLGLQQLDRVLQEGAEGFYREVELEWFRTSLSPGDKAWWWYLDQLSFPYLSPRSVWVWKGLSVLTWTVNLGLLLNIAGRFILGGPGVWGVAAVALPSILALLQAKNGLTEAGAEGGRQFLKGLGVPKRFWQQAQFLSTLGLFVGLLGFWWSLPWISERYSLRGLQDYNGNQLGSAAQNYQRAIALNPDNAEAHYNLGNVYEDLQELESASKEYLFAVKQQLPQAFNNLGRLYLQQKKYSQAAALLLQGLEKDGDARPELRFSLFKNLGWVRFQQSRDQEAQTYLETAISIASSPEVKPYINSPASAHCLLAQVLERSKQAGSRDEWQKCQDLGSSLNPDEDAWLHLAQVRLSSSRK